MKGYSSRHNLVINCGTCGVEIHDRSQYRKDSVCFECARARSRRNASEQRNLKVNRIAILERRRKRYVELVAKYSKEIEAVKNEK